jgi:hypothetical protein
MDQKKVFNLFVIVSNLLHQGFELVEQRHHQSRFGARHHRVSLQARLLEKLGDFLGFLSGPRISALFEEAGQLFYRSGAGCLQSGIGPQEGECRGLLQLAEHFQRDRVVGYASGDELIDQPDLHLHQALLIAGQRFEFLDLFTVRVESAQVREVGPPGLGQQIGINGIGLGSRESPSPFHRPRIDWVNRPSVFQQMRDHQSMGGLNNTGELVFSSWPCHPFQVGVQLTQSFGTMSNADRSQLMALVVDAQRIMMVICPINTAKLHRLAPYLRPVAFLNSCVLLLCRSKRDSLMTSRVQKPCQGRTSFLNRSSRVETKAFPRQVRQSIRASVLLAPAPCRGGLVQY